MADRRHILRKIQPARYRRIDDQWWPLVVAMVVLGGFLVGSVLAYLRWDDPRWYANAWTWLIAIPLIITAALAALAWTGNRWLRRTMQLSIVLGVIFHVVLLLLALETDVFERVWTEVLAAAERPRPKQIVKVPDYLSWQHDAHRRTLRDLHQPVEVRVPDPAVESVPREQVASPPPDMDIPPPQVPRPEDRPLPSLADRAEPNQAVPRQRDEMSKLSRRQAAAVPERPTQRVELPSVVPRPERREPSLQPEMRGLRPQQLAETPPQPPAHRPAESPAHVPTSPEGRRPEQARPAPQQPAPTTLARREPRQTVTPQAQAEPADRPPSTPEAPPMPPTPQKTAAETLQQRTRAPDARDTAETPPMAARPAPAAGQRKVEQPAPPRDTLAGTPRSVPSRQPRVTTRPDLTAMVDRLPDAPTVPPPVAPTAETPTAIRVERAQTGPATTTQPGQRAAAPAAPAPTTVAPQVAQRPPDEQRPDVDVVGAALPGRKPAASPALGSLSQRVSPESSNPAATQPSYTPAGPPSSADVQVAKRAAGNANPELPRPSAETIGASVTHQTPLRQMQRPTTAPAPSLSAVPEKHAERRRAVRGAPVATSPLMAETPSHAASTADGAEPTTEPASMALNKAEVGMAGRGDARNLAQADLAAASPGVIASGSARRAAVTQNLLPGPAIEPHDAAIVRRGQAGLTRPSTVLEANALDPTLLAAERQTADIQASASAALTQAAADAQPDRVTASKGDLDVDTGPTTLVAESGAGRGAGGGQPELSLGTPRERAQRARTGRALSPALLAETVGAATAASSAGGGGEPSAAAVDAGADSLVDARTGPEFASFGGPRALGGGPESVPTPSPARAARRDHGMLDQLPLGDVAERDETRVARKDSANRQVPVDLGIADVRAGQAADRADHELPSSTLSVGDTTISRPARATSGYGSGPSGAAGTLAVVDSAAAERMRDLAGRAEAPEAIAGPPAVGGGTGSPAQSARASRPRASAATDADAVLLAGIAGSEGLMVQSAGKAGGPGKRTPPVSLPGDAAAVDMSDLVSPSDAVAARGPDLGPDPDLGVAIGDPQPGPLSRPAGQALKADLTMPEGVGGLGSAASVEVGLATRRASEESADIQFDTPRFNRNRVGGQLSFSPMVAVPTEPFQRRIQRVQGMDDPSDGTGPQTEDAIELGLVFLSKAQLPDGRWSLDRFAKEDGLPQLASDSAATGLALLAFQGAGYNHLDFRYAQVVRRGLDFLLKNQQLDGSLYVPMDEESNRVVQFYSHSIATLAMCEAYGMTQDPTLREPAQRAIDFLVETQNGQRGGWRYTRGVGADTSVTGWVMMALKSGELANLKVPKETYRAIDRWLDTAQASPNQPHLYCYNPFAPDTVEQRGGRVPTPTMTSVGLLMRLYLGWHRDHPAFARGTDYLAKRPPAIGTRTNPQRDTYYWYYGTQVMFHKGGQHWRDWNHALHPLLVDTQIREGELAGSWDPRRPVPDRWAAHAGRLYVTTMNLLSLEVTYRHLPLYDDTAK